MSWTHWVFYCNNNKTVYGSELSWPNNTHIWWITRLDTHDRMVSAFGDSTVICILKITLHNVLIYLMTNEEKCVKIQLFLYTICVISFNTHSFYTVESSFQFTYPTFLSILCDLSPRHINFLLYWTIVFYRIVLYM